MKIKRLLSMLTVIAMLFSLMAVAGCGKKDSGSSLSGIAASDNSEEEFFLEMPSELEGTTVKFATWIDHSQTDTAEVLAGFEKATGMKYEWFNVTQDEYINKLVGLIAADQAPDVIVENGDFPRTLELLQPLTKETTALDPTDPFWNQEITKLFTFGGKTYLVNGANSTWDLGGHVVYYNRTVLEENGLKTPEEYVAEDNWNLNTFKTLLTQIQQRAGLEGKSAIDVSAILAMFGASETYIDSETHQFVNGINSAAALDAMKYVFSLKEQDLVQVMLSGCHDSLGNGKAALQLAGAYGLRNKPGWFYEMDYEDLAYAPLPKVNADDANYPSTASTRAYGVCAGSKNPMGAGYFLRFFLNGENYDELKVFKSQEAADLWKQCVASADFSTVNFSRGVRMTLYADEGGLEDGVLGDILWSNQSQLAVNLEASRKKVDSCVNEANKILKNKIESEK